MLPYDCNFLFLVWKKVIPKQSRFDRWKQNYNLHHVFSPSISIKLPTKATQYFSCACMVNSIYKSFAKCSQFHIAYKGGWLRQFDSQCGDSLIAMNLLNISDLYCLHFFACISQLNFCDCIFLLCFLALLMYSSLQTL